MLRDTYHSRSTDKIGICFVGYTKWMTKEQLALYNYKNGTLIYLNTETIYQTSTEELKFCLSRQFKIVADKLPIKNNPHFISTHSGVERTCVNKMYLAKHIPNAVNTANLILFILEYMPKFCLWYLFSNSAPIEKDVIQKPNFIKRVDKEDFKKNLSRRLISVFNKINKNWNIYWVSLQCSVGYMTIKSILNNDYSPSLSTLLRIVIFINNHIDNFNFWFLFSDEEPMTTDEHEHLEDFFQPYYFPSTYCPL
jgi:hypothetical protein